MSPSALPHTVASMRWYHTLELPDGIVTPGEYDLRPIVESLPWPDLHGARCLDVGSRDGFFAFEMERRGAAEVVSVDIDDPAGLHFPGPPAAWPSNEAIQAELDAGNRAFEVARKAKGSAVRRELMSVYDVAPEELGIFDFAMIGTLLLHLRDPVAALQAIREVVSGRLLINEPITVELATIRRPAAELMMPPGLPFWWLPNPAGLRRLAEAAGFEVLATGKPYVIPFGAGGSPRSVRACLSLSVRRTMRRLAWRRGAAHVWMLAQSLAEREMTDPDVR